MISLLTLVGIGSLIVSTISYVIYITDIIKGKTKPHSFSWLVWSVLGLTVFLIQTVEGAGAGAWVNGYSAIACAVIFLLALKFGEKKIVLVDWIFLAGACLSYVLWLVTKHALPSIILLTTIDFFGFLPTYRKSYHKPFEESASMYWLSSLKYVLSILATSNLTLVNLLYPIVLMLLNGLFTVMLYVRRRALTSS